MIYVLDANLYFGMVVDMVRAMNIRVPFCNELPDAFVVGIGYPVEGSLSEQLHQVMHLRARDFTLAREEEAEQWFQEQFPVPTPTITGNQGPFLQFIQQELLPLIDSEYRTDPADRTLLGHSMGSTFALFTLFRHPGLFQRYVAAAGWDIAQMEQYAEQRDSPPARLHLVNDDSSAEGTAHFEAYLNRLESLRNAGLRLTHQVIANCTHCAMVPPAFQAGLVAVFS